MKPRKRNHTEIELSGQDSFLDLVSNIVGILIILVMVAGVRSQYSSANVAGAAKAEPSMLAELDAKYQELQTKSETAAKLRMDVEDLKMQTEILGEQTYLQSREYAALFDVMTSVRAAIDLAAEEKSQMLKEKIEYQRLLLETNAQLEQIDRTRNYFRQVRPKATVVENIPTPLSRTVETKEIHVRLLGGRIVYVPLNELAIQLRGHIIDEKYRYYKQKSSTGKVGPIENFELEFLLVTYDVPVRGGGFETRIDLQYGEIVPKLEPLGQPLRQALASPQSEFCRKLFSFQKNIYTVTVWVYSDSFEEYQVLKQFLQERGYSVAARPMMLGHPIGISPHGSRSSTQ